MFDLCATTTLAALPENGPYFSVFKIIVLLVLPVPWLWAATWMNRDTLRVHTVPAVWLGLVLGGGLLGLLAWLLVPIYVIGLVLFVGLAAGTLGAYVAHRNKRVVPEARVLTPEHIRSVLSRQKHDQVEVIEKVKVYNCYGKAVFPPEAEQTRDREAYNAAQGLLDDVVKLRASQADVAVAGAQAVVRLVVDGVIQNRPAMDARQAELMIEFVKQHGGLEVKEKRRPQTGKISLDVGSVRADVDVTTAGTTHGQRMQLRVLQESVQTRLEQLGMPDSLMTKLVELNAADAGLIVVSGPRRNGVTSTLYSLLRKHDAFMKQLATLEQAPEADLENVSQLTYEGVEELPDRLASLLRRDPDVVMIDTGEGPAAGPIADAAREKNLLLGCNAESVFVALARWVKAVGDRGRALAHLRAITCQRLLRKLCPNCKEPYRPATEMLSKLNLPAEKIEKFFRPPTKPLTDEKGRPITCSTCQGTHYYGRTAAFELLEMTDDIRELIVNNAPLSRIKAACRKNGMLYLQEQALRHVINGDTSVEEVIRVSRQKTGAAPA